MGGTRSRVIRSAYWVALLLLIGFAGVAVVQLSRPTENPVAPVERIPDLIESGHPPLSCEATLTTVRKDGVEERWKAHIVVAPPHRMRLILFAVEPFEGCSGFLAPPAGKAVASTSSGLLVADLIDGTIVERGWEPAGAVPGRFRGSFGALDDATRLDFMASLGLTFVPATAEVVERGKLERDGRSLEFKSYVPESPLSLSGYEVAKIVVYTDPEWSAPVRREFFGADDRMVGFEELRGVSRTADGGLIFSESLSEWSPGRIDVELDAEVTWSEQEPPRKELWSAPLEYTPGGRRIRRSYAQAEWGLPFPSSIQVETLDGDPVLEMRLSDPVRETLISDSWFQREGLLDGWVIEESPGRLAFVAALSLRNPTDSGLRLPELSDLLEASRRMGDAAGPYRRPIEHSLLIARLRQAKDVSAQLLSECVDHATKEDRGGSSYHGTEFVRALFRKGEFDSALRLADELGRRLSQQMDAEALLGLCLQEAAHFHPRLDLAFAALHAARGAERWGPELAYVSGLFFEGASLSIVHRFFPKGEASIARRIQSRAKEAFLLSLQAPETSPLRYFAARALHDPKKDSILRRLTAEALASRSTGGLDLKGRFEPFREALQSSPGTPGASVLRALLDSPSGVHGALKDPIVEALDRRSAALVERLEGASDEERARLIAEAATLVVGAQAASVRPPLPQPLSTLVEEQIEEFARMGRAFLSRWSAPEEAEPRAVVAARWEAAIRFLKARARDPLCPYLKEPLRLDAADVTEIARGSAFPGIAIGQVSTTWNRWHPPSPFVAEKEGISKFHDWMQNPTTSQWTAMTPQIMKAYRARAAEAVERAAEMAVLAWINSLLAYGQPALNLVLPDGTTAIALSTAVQLDGNGGLMFVSGTLVELSRRNK